MNARRVIKKPRRWVAAKHPLVVLVWWALVGAGGRVHVLDV
ncbi:MAG: hypothetical protein GIKADHBN_00425 [Phycisphaerales bacterium]|nr:hypothetical protein [Phycisphaerales bacterium]